MRIASGVTDQVIYFVAVDSTDFTTRETGLSSFTVYRDRNGGGATAMTTPTVTEVDATNMPGVYKLLLDEDMTIGSGNDTEEMVFHITATGMAPVTRTIELFRRTVTSGETLTSSSGAATVGTNNDKTGYSISGTITTLDGLNDLDAGGVRTAVGLASANLDTQLAALPTAVENRQEMDSNSTQLAAIVADTNELQMDDYPASFTTLQAKLLAYAQLLARKDAAIASDLSTELGEINNDEGSGAGAYDNTSDALEALRDRGDSAWTTGAGGTPPQLLQNTTIATLASQTSFTLTAGSADDDAYVGAVIVVTDQSTSTQKAVGSISAYTGSSKTVTLTSDPAIFTMAVGDTVDIIANASTAPTAAAVADAVLDEALSGHATAGTLGKAVSDIVADTNELQMDDVPGLIAALNDLDAAGVRTAVGLASANLDTQLAALPTAAENRAEMDSNSTQLAAIVADTAEIGAAGAGLSAIPWNAAWDAEVQSECADALTAYGAATAADAASPAEVATEVADALATDTHSEVASVPAANAPLSEKIGWLFLLARNKGTFNKSTGVGVVRNNADSADVATFTAADDGTTVTRPEWS